MLRLSFSLGKPYGFFLQQQKTRNIKIKSQQNERRQKIKAEIEWKNQEPKALEIEKCSISFIRLSVQRINK